LKYTKQTKGNAQDNMGIQEGEISYYLQEQTCTNARFFLDEDIKEARYYRPLVQHLLSASERDTVEVLLSTGGGDLGGCLQVLEALKCTSADTTAIVMGDCHSAGSIVAMYCNDVVVLDSACMLVHSASYGTGRQKSRDVKDYVEFSSAYLEGIFRDAYEGFLNEEELQEVMNGRELWLTAQDIRDRLQARSEYLREKFENSKGESEGDSVLSLDEFLEKCEECLQAENKASEESSEFSPEVLPELSEVIQDKPKRSRKKSV
jgi:ATP-dependent protease ClpP protease subunit